MPDRYEPKVSVRPLSERRPAQSQADDDPLIELARIVSGRTTADPVPPARPKPASAAPTTTGYDFAGDLEAELLNDLQASFATIRDPRRSTTPAPAAAPATPPPAVATRPAPAPAPRAAPPSSPAPAPAARPTQAAAASTEPQLRATAPAPVKRPPPPAAPAARSEAPLPARPAAKAIREPSPPAHVPAPRTTERPASVERPERKVSAATAPSAPPRAPAPSRPPSASSGVGENNAWFRPAKAGSAERAAPTNPAPRAPVTPAPPKPSLPEPAARASSTRWDPPEQEAAASVASRFAPPRAAARIRPPPPPPPAPPRREPDPVDDDAYGDAPAYLESDAVYDDDFTPEDIDAPAAYEPEDDLPPFPEEEFEELGRRRSGRLIGALGVLALLAIAGAGAFYFFGPTYITGTPPIIVADAAPTKITPEETASTPEADQQNKLIYDRVDDPSAGEDTTLVTPAEDSVGGHSGRRRCRRQRHLAGDHPRRTRDRCGAPRGRCGRPRRRREFTTDEGGATIVDPAETAADADAADNPIGPKKVRTVVVRPDGTIVSSEAVDEGATAAAIPDASDAAPALRPGDNAVATGTRTQMDAVLEGGNIPVDTDPLSTRVGRFQGRSGGRRRRCGRRPGNEAKTTAAALLEERYPDLGAGAGGKGRSGGRQAGGAGEGHRRCAGQHRPTPTFPRRQRRRRPRRPPSRRPRRPRRSPAAPLSRSPRRSRKKRRDRPSATFRRSSRRSSARTRRTSSAPISARRACSTGYASGRSPAADAQRLCDDLKSAGGDCIISR